MNEVPVMISTKDLAYLSDMFEWQFVMCKKINHYCSEVNDEEIKSISIKDSLTNIFNKPMLEEFIKFYKDI